MRANVLSRSLGPKLDAKAPLWSVDFPGQSTPVIADGRLYINGYQGDGQDLQEFLACFDAHTRQIVTNRMYFGWNPITSASFEWAFVAFDDTAIALLLATAED